jgi:membrane-bound metal-dependent hydrolase YbcI (DUF457 family)
MPSVSVANASDSGARRLHRRGTGALAKSAARLAGRAWRYLPQPSPGWILLAAGLFAADQVVYQHAGAAVFPQAPLDWTAHLLTTLFIVWALSPLVRGRRLAGALVFSVLIDVDHIPGRLGSNILTAGTARPYTHSIAIVLALALLALAWPAAREFVSGAALGVASHLWRDLAEPHGSGVALLWPLSDRTITTPAVVYLGSLGVVAAVGFARAWSRGRVTAATGVTA